jgi:hypothetical protein
MANGNGNATIDFQADPSPADSPVPKIDFQADSSGVEPSPFPADAWLRAQVKDLPPDERAAKTSGFISAAYTIAKPWMDAGYSAQAAFNRGMAHFATTLGLALRKPYDSAEEGSGPVRQIPFFDEAAKEASANADYWETKVKKDGASGISEFLGNVVGGAIPGGAEFLTGVASGLTIPYFAGAEKKREQHATDPVIGGMVEAAKTGTMAMLFSLVGPFNRYIQATTLGTTFGAQDALEAPKGKRLQAFGQGAATGGLLGAVSAPEGGIGLKDIYPEVGPKNIPESMVPAKPVEQVPDQRVTQDPDIRELTENLKNVPRDTSFEDRQNIADSLKKTYTGALGKIQTATAGLKATGQTAWDFYNKPPEWTNFDDMFGQFLGARQKTGIEIDRFGKQIIESMPDREQQAVTRYMQADGDEAVLRDWADRSADPEVKQKYEDALRLPEETKSFAKNARAYWDGKLDDMISAGVLDHGVENYVTQAWDKNKDNPVAQRLLSEAYSGKLTQNPSFAKKRIFDSYFDGEQAGYAPKDDRIGYLIASYEKMADQTLAARQFVTQLSHGTAADGRPLVLTKGIGTALPKGERPAEAYIINPNAVGAVYAKDAAGKRLTDGDGEPVEVNTRDYRTIDHPALRKQKWVEKDNEGNPIFVLGDLKVHPEIYDRLKNYLGTSAIRDWLPGRLLLRGSAEVKGTMLGFFSPFHQVHLSVTAATHAVNPLSDVLPDKIDLDDPVTSKLIDHSLKVYDSDGMAAFSEGNETAGLERFIPYVGKYAEQYQQYLFGADGFIPRLKIHFAKVAYERNTERYPELTDDQVAKLSADQANASFGGQNYEFMGRNKTTQDLLRLGALAPNFLESRARSAAQAFMPYGREQFTALVIRGAIGMYVAAKITEGIAHLIDPDNNEVHWDKPFSATIDGKEYSLRSEQGDIYHLVSDPRSFVYFRLSPALAKPAIEAITGRDNWGRLKDAPSQIKDWATAAVPIAGQGFFNKQDYGLYQSVLQSIGVSSWNARTEAEKLVIDIESEKSKEVLPAATQKRMQVRGQLGDAFQKTGDFEPVRKAVEQGQITPNDVKSILQRSVKGDVLRGVTGFSVPDALRVWDKANDKEKASIQMEVIKKWFGWTATSDEREPYADEIQKVIEWKPSRPIKQRRFSIRSDR